MSEQSEGLSPSQTDRGLRAFMGTGILFGLWARCAGMGTAVLTGYILWMGGDESDIAWLTSIAYFASLIQIFTVQYTSKIRNRRAFIVAGGFVEIAFRFFLIFIPLVASDHTLRIALAYVLITIGLCFSYSVAPLLNDWLAQIIPERMRAQFTGQRTTYVTIAGIIGGYLFGEFLDHFGENFTTFGWLFVFGLLAGWSGYLCLLRAPIPETNKDEVGSVVQALKDMLKHPSVRPFLIFATLRQFVIGISTPFYMVYFIKQLALDYTTIAIFTNIALIATLVAYKVSGHLVDRFGSRPVMLVLVIPGALGQLLRVFTSPDSYFLVPISMAIYAMYHAGMVVALNPLLYSMLPKKKNRPAWFAAWTCTTFMLGGMAPIVGNFLSGFFKSYPTEWLGYPIGNLQWVFVCSTVGLIATAPLIFLIQEKKAQTTGELVFQTIKGRPLAYAYHAFNMSFFTDEDRRASATRGMGSSGSPMAVENLMRALSDISPEVRKKAAEGLGELGSEEAVGSLIDHLTDHESDIRAEVVDALGKIRHPLGVDALTAALDDPDTNVRNSAIRGLGNIGGSGIRRLLYKRLYQSDFDRQTFPTLIDTLSRLDEARIVTIALGKLQEFKSPILRAQILNSVCRVLGAGDSFYRLTIMDELKQASQVNRALIKALKELEAASKEIPSLSGKPLDDMTELCGHFEAGRIQDAYQCMIRLSESIVEATDPDTADDSSVELTLARGSAGALYMFASQISRDEVTDLEIVFASICLCLCISELKGMVRDEEQHGDF